MGIRGRGREGKGEGERQGERRRGRERGRHACSADFIGFVPLPHFKRYKFNFKRFDAK